MTSDALDDNDQWKDDYVIHQHGALSVMRGISRSDAHAARLPTRLGTAVGERR
jgi:hypothetical protein